MAVAGLVWSRLSAGTIYADKEAIGYAGSLMSFAAPAKRAVDCSKPETKRE